MSAGRQADSENAEKKVQELQAAKEQVDKELKLMEGKLAQALQQKREAYTKSRKVDQEREKHRTEMDNLVSETDRMRREMEQKLHVTAQEQVGGWEWLTSCGCGWSVGLGAADQHELIGGERGRQREHAVPRVAAGRPAAHLCGRARLLER